MKAYMKRGKIDAADAEAICAAVTRPTMRIVAVKCDEQHRAITVPDDTGEPRPDTKTASRSDPLTYYPTMAT